MQVTHSLRDYGFERWAGVLTWLMLAAISLWLAVVNLDFGWFSTQWLSALGLFVVYIVAFSFATRDQALPREPYSRFVLMALQLCCAYGLFWLLPFGFLAILITMWCAQLPYFVTVRTAVLIAALVSVPHAVIFQWHWQQSGAWLSAVLFWAFHLFAILMMASQLREVRAREREQAANRELRATQALLNEANKQQERTRIARNIHDLLGHHLTALSIQLQVAERKSDGEVKTLLQESQSIAKLLLADVREAVSDIRAASDMPLKSILQELVYQHPEKQVELEVEPTLRLRDVEVADAVVRICQEGISNFMRHAKGNRLVITVRRELEQLLLSLQDNGSVPASLPEGNGLKGMRDRVQALGGEFELSTTAGVSVSIRLPLEDE